MEVGKAAGQERSGTRAPWSAQLLSGANVVCTGTAQGDMASSAQTRASVLDLPWTVLRQVHGKRVVVVSSPGECFGEQADAAVSRSGGLALAVLTADCAPVALSSEEGVIGVAHAGWAGLEAGVLEATVSAMVDLGATKIEAVLGPCIGPECYEFGHDDLLRLAGRYGQNLIAQHAAGSPALNIRAGVASALEGCGVRLTQTAPFCTACSDGYWSWRARKDKARQATVVWSS